MQERDWNKSDKGGLWRCTWASNTALPIDERGIHTKIGDGKQAYQLTRIGYSFLGQLLLNSTAEEALGRTSLLPTDNFKVILDGIST